MFNLGNVRESKEEKFWRLFRQVSSEYGPNIPEWIWDYCQACAYGNNVQFMRAVNKMFYDLP